MRRVTGRGAAPLLLLVVVRGGGHHPPPPVPAPLGVAPGHGGADPAGEAPPGLASAVRRLELNSYKVKPLDLLTEPSVPTSCTVLLLAAPTAELGPAADAIKAYLAGNGRAVV